MRVLFVGDLHHNEPWLHTAVFPTVEANDVDLIIQVGDLGWWPWANTFTDALQSSPVPFWFIDGNHEHHPHLKTVVGANPPLQPTPIDGNLFYLPRGTRVTVEDVTFLFCGGAHSVDRNELVEGDTWFPDEDITDSDVNACTIGGTVDVLVSHDCPNRWTVPDIPPFFLNPGFQGEQHACRTNRNRLARVFDTVEPNLVVHGHYHTGYQQHFDTGWGPLHIIGLNRDDHPDMFAMIDIDAGTWRTVNLSVV